MRLVATSQLLQVLNHLLTSFDLSQIGQNDFYFLISRLLYHRE